MDAICTGLIKYFCFCIGPSIVSYDNGVNNKEFIMSKSLHTIEQPFSGKAGVRLAGGQAHLIGQAGTILKGELHA
jgi:hypothetical protein